MSHVDARIATIAGRQGGCVGRDQLEAAGVSPEQIRQRLLSGHLHRRRPGVYAVGHPTLGEVGLLWEAVLSVDGDAAVTARGAAWSYGFAPWPRGRLEVIVPHASGARSDGTRRVIRSRRFEAVERAGLPVTKPTRTLVEMSMVVPERRFRRALNQALVMKVIGRHDLEEIVSGAEGRRSSGMVRRVVGRHLGPTRSGTEEAAARLLVEAGLPRPLVNAKRFGIESDLSWPDYRLVVEIDGPDFHFTPYDVVDDRHDEEVLRSRGIDTVRYSAVQVEDTPVVFVRSVETELRRRGWTGRVWQGAVA